MTKHNLPAQATSFVGREQETADFSAVLHDPNCRLLTFCGPGGIGKTRLAIEVAIQNLDHFPDGIWLVNLEPLTLVDEIVPAVMSALGLKLQDGRNLRQQLFDYLSHKRVLLVMDNFEHLLDSVGLMTDLLDATSGITILVTSREPLKLREEWIRHIRGLDVPDHEQVANLENYSAVRLFVADAHRVNGDFSLASVKACVVRLCQMVEGLPLALELAASWLRVMPCAMIITELQHSLDLLESPLKNMPVRHQSIRAVFDQSWRLLSGEERDAFKNLATFRGGFFQEAATFVSGATLSMLLNLVDKALLRVDADGRYYLHSLLRQYVEEKLRDSSIDYMMVSDQHCQYYTEFLDDRELDVWGGNNQRARNDIGKELDNIRRALAWALEQQNLSQLDKAISTFAEVCYNRSLWTEGYTLYRRIAALARSARDDGVLWQVLASQGWFAHSLADFEQAARLYDEALIIGRQSHWQGRASFKNFLMLRLCEMAMRQGNLVKANQFVGELADDQTSSRSWMWVWIRETQGRIEYLAANFQEATNVLQHGLSLARTFQYDFGMIVIANHLAYVYLALGEYTTARRVFAEALARGLEANYERAVTRSLVGLGLATFYLEESDTAWSYFSQAWDKSAKIRHGLEIINTVIGIAELLATAGREVQALELLICAHAHPAADWEAQEKAKRLLNMLKRTLSTETITQATTQAKTLELNIVVESILTERQVVTSDGKQSATDLLNKHTPSEDEQTPQTNLATPKQILNANQALLEPLTKRELEVLQLVASGHSNRQVAEQLFIAMSTVKKHVTHIFAKLGVTSRTQAINRGRELHLL